MATIRKLKSGRWQAVVRKKNYPSVSETFVKKVLADRWAKQIEEQMDLGKFVHKNSIESPLIIDVLKKYVEEVGHLQKSNHRSTSLNVIIHFGFLDGVLARDLSKDHIVKIFKFRRGDQNTNVQTGAREPASPDTVKKNVETIKLAIDFANDVRDMDLPNPVPDAMRLINKFYPHLLVGDDERDRRLNPGEEEIIINQSYSGDIPINQIAILAIDTAMRRGELVKFNINNFDKAKKTYKIQQSKTDHQTGEKGRVIPLTDRAIKIIDAITPDEEGWLFPWPPDSVSQAWANYAEAMGFDDCRLHDLRHEATSRLFELGLSIQEVAVITGHRDWKSLKRYTHIKPKLVGDKMRKLAKLAKACALAA